MTKDIKLDLRDQRILSELDSNARQSASKIAKKVRLSKDVVNYRIKRLESLGIIKGYYTVIDPTKLGYITFDVLLNFYYVTPEKEDAIVDYLQKHNMVGWLARIEGRWNVNFVVWAQSVYDFKEFWFDFFREYGNYIFDSHVSIITDLIHFNKGVLVNDDVYEPNKLVSGGKQALVTLDKTDQKILEVLATNARMSLIEIAQKTGTTAKVVEYRIANLHKKGVILGFKVLLDLDLLKLRYYRMRIALQNMTRAKEKQLMAFAEMHRNIFIIVVPVGGKDFEVEILVKSFEEYQQIKDEMKSRFTGIIKDIESHFFYNELKVVYLPVL